MSKRSTGADQASAPKRRDRRTDADREAKGYGRLTLRLPLNTLAQLNELSESGGLGKGELIAAMIAMDYESKT